MVPRTVLSGEIGVAVLAVRNSSATRRRNVFASLTIPSGVREFLAFGSGGECSNLLSNCIPGARLEWQIGDLAPSEIRYWIAPIRPESVTGGIPLSARVFWDGGSELLSDQLGVESRLADRGLVGYRGDGGGLRVWVEPAAPTVRAGVVVPLVVRVENQSDAVIDEVFVRLVVPNDVEGFLSLGADALCINRNLRCNPGTFVRWDVGSLAPKSAYSAVAPIEVGQPTSRALMLCAAANGRTGSGGIACANVLPE